MLQTVSKEYFAQTRFLFHCHFKIKTPRDHGEDILNDCFKIAEAIDMKYNSYQPDSYFSRINQQAGSWVEVDETCVELLKTIKLISSLTMGSYDITCMPLLHLWGFYSNEKQTIPSSEDIERVLKKVDYRKIEIKDLHVRIAPNQEIITGSFIKAFAVDRIEAFLRASGVTDAIVNAGSSTIKALNDETHKSWKVNIPNPLVKGMYSTPLHLSNNSFSLSGKSNNHVLIDNEVYGHILNSRTGLPIQTEQVGVITKSAFVSDVLSTAIHSVAKEEVSVLVKKLTEHFQFSYFRVEGDGSKTQSICF